MPDTTNILFIHSGRSSFVKEDLKILDQFSQIREFHFIPSNSIVKLTANFVRQFFWLLKNISSANACFCWFSDYHGLLPLLFSRMFNIPFIAVLGGFDCNKFKHLNYGIFCSLWRGPLGAYILRNSTLLLPVNKTLIETKPIARNWPEAHPNGIKENVKNFNTEWKETPTGYDPNLWKMGVIERGKKVCTVAASPNYKTALRKGLDLYIQTAALMPDFTFIIVGLPDHVKKQLLEKFPASENLYFAPRLPREELNIYYSQSSVYLQLSRAEGLPNVLCEAMMCGCVPVGSAVFGIPHGIGDAGYIAKKPDPEEISGLVRMAHQNAENFRPKARQRIIDNFSLARRERELMKIIRDITTNNSSV